MARDVEADVNINDKSTRGLSSFLGNLRKADDAVKKTQGDIDKAAASTGKFGKATDENSKSLGKLHHELGIAQHELGSLARAFANAGSAAERIDITKAMRRQNTEIRNLTKNADILKGLIPDEADLSRFTKVVGGSLRQAVSGAGEALGPVLVGVGIAAAPILGSTVAAAVIGGAGLGGIVGGLVIASRDPRVQDAFKGATAGLKTELEDAAAAFVDPAIDGIHQIKGALDTVNFKQIFGDASRYLKPLVAGISVAVEKIGNGFEKAVHGAGPVVEMIGRGVASLGDAVGQVFDELSDNGVEAAQALQIVFGGLTAAIKVTGKAVNFLTESFGFLAKIGLYGRDIQLQYLSISTAQDIASKSATATSASQKVLRSMVLSTGEAAGKAGRQMQTYADQMDEAATKGRGLYDSQTDVAEAADRAKKAVHDNGNTLSLNSEKGRENRRVLSQLAGSLTDNYKAYVKVNGEGAAAQGIAEKNRNQFVKLATQFGLTKTQASNLATQMGLIPAKKTTDFYANARNAEDQIKALQKRINNVHGKSVTITVYTRTVGGKTNAAGDEALHGHRAAGGPVYPNKSYLVGENGPEILQMGSQGGNVIPNNEIGGGNVYEFHIDLADGVKKVIKVHDRQLKRRTNARVATV